MVIRTFIVCILTAVVCSCNQTGSKKNTSVNENRIIQQNDGSVSLNLQKASCYSDAKNPANNTADWSVVISHPGRFKIWLTSATKDTVDLKYSGSVRISLLDNNLEVDPACDRIIKNSDEVHYPYFRADSYVGSVYFSEPGEYNIQLISEKVFKGATESKSDTQLLAINLTPIIQ
jgi:hypothetical protein